MKLTNGERIRGRLFTPAELDIIKGIVSSCSERGRTAASIEVCKALDWKQPNGWLKDRACRDVLRELSKRGYFNLPKRKANTGGNKRRIEAYDFLHQDLDTTELTDLNFNSITIKQVKGTEEEQLWNWLVNKHHYLGFSVAVGRALKYIAQAEARPLAALCFSDPAWAVKARDDILQTLPLHADAIRHQVINNSRFLICPWVKVPNLASKVLALATKQVKKDWKEYYAVKPLLIETFVDTTKFRGSSYRAANWFLIGNTKGYLKSGNRHQNSQSKKAIYVYPLEKRLRTVLKKTTGGENGVSYRRADRKTL